MIDKNNNFFTVQEVAELLRVDHKTIRRYIKQGKIKAYKLSTQTIRIPRSEIEYLLK